MFVAEKVLLHLVISLTAEVHYYDVIMTTVASQITSLKIVYSTVYSDADQRKHQSSASLAFVRGIHRGPVNCPHKWPVTRKMFPFDDVIMLSNHQVWVVQILVRYLITVAMMPTLSSHTKLASWQLVVFSVQRGPPVHYLGTSYLGLSATTTHSILFNKNIERHAAHTIVSWPNTKQWVIVNTSDLMMIIRQKIYIYIFIQSSQGKWVNWKHTAPHFV